MPCGVVTRAALSDAEHALREMPANPLPVLWLRASNRCGKAAKFSQRGFVHFHLLLLGGVDDL
jgi:hypothetical protein